MIPTGSFFAFVIAASILLETKALPAIIDAMTNVTTLKNIMIFFLSLHYRHKFFFFNQNLHLINI